MNYNINEINAISTIVNSENYYDILRTLTLEYAKRSVSNSAQLTKLIADIAEKAIQKSNEDKMKADGMLYLLTCVMRDGIENINDGMFPFLLDVMVYKYPEGEDKNGCQAEKELFEKFVSMFKSKDVNKQFLNDDEYLNRYGFKDYINKIKSKYGI